VSHIRGRSGPDLQRLLVISQRLRLRERLFWARIVASLAGGAVLSFAVPTLITSLVWMWSWPSAGSWWGVFWLSSGALLPLLYAIELRTGGDFHMNELRSRQAGGQVGNEAVPAGCGAGIGVCG